MLFALGRSLGNMDLEPVFCMTLKETVPARFRNPNIGCRYYVLVAACVFARKAEWIRNAGLAAVLLFPAVAALHGIVLATLHREGEFILARRGLQILPLIKPVSNGDRGG